MQRNSPEVHTSRTLLLAALLGVFAALALFTSQTQVAIERTRKSVAETRALIVELRFACFPEKHNFGARRIRVTNSG
jgi:hypothetical protein